MGQSQSRHYNFEDVQHIVKTNKGINTTILINVLKEYEQTCLIKDTIDIKNEVNIINKYLKTNKHVHIIVYGSNSCDENIEKKTKTINFVGFL